MTSQSLLAACCLVLLGVGLYLGPPAVADRVRGTINDLLHPGLNLVRLSQKTIGNRLDGNVDEAHSVGGRPADNRDVAELADALAIAQERIRQLQVRLAEQSERQLPEQEISRAMLKSERLIVPSLVEVAVLGDTLADKWRTGKLLDQGAKNGLRENELILSARKSPRSLIDFGEDAQISTEDALLLGRCVIGKVEYVGRWTSTIQLVTDADYAGRAQLIRETSDGLFVFGEARGILKGQGGPMCKLEGIPAESSVHVHDAVYTAERDGILPTPLYYGQVVEATLGPDDREWTVIVKPAPLPTRLTKVQVLRTAVNPERLAVK